MEFRVLEFLLDFGNHHIDLFTLPTEDVGEDARRV